MEIQGLSLSEVRTALGINNAIIIYMRDELTMLNHVTSLFRERRMSEAYSSLMSRSSEISGRLVNLEKQLFDLQMQIVDLEVKQKDSKLDFDDPYYGMQHYSHQISETQSKLQISKECFEYEKKEWGSLKSISDFFAEEKVFEAYRALQIRMNSINRDLEYMTERGYNLQARENDLEVLQEAYELEQSWIADESFNWD